VARLKAWLGLALLVAAPLAFGDTLGQRIDAHLTAPRFAAASWGVAVVSLDDGHVVYQHDSQRLLLPASTAKLYTAAFTLDRLGAGYRTHTDVVATSAIERGRLRGTLVLRGRGDPTLAGDAWADALASQLHDKGLTRLDGDIVGDDTAFAGPPVGSGWEAGDLQDDYAAVAGGLDIDENTMTVTLGAGTVGVLPGDAAVTLAVQSAAALQVYRAPGSTTVHVLGGTDDGAPARRLRLSLPDPALTAARRLQAALARQGIRVDGEARSVHWPVPPPSGDVLASFASPTLGDILHAGLKRSQNLYLQSAFLLGGLEATDQAAPRTEDRAAVAIAAWLDARGIGASSVLLEEGTGLSRRDLTTASALTRLLVLEDASPDAAAWRDRLPLAAVDGTLAKRMTGTAAAANVQAKTGSMTYVNALAGYVTTKAGQRLAFAILLNNYRAPEGTNVPASADVDAIAIMLAESTDRL
jgi:D-alanyl-D-alanine carboxypeptidase/D-alanyl-D-alanine-endopeptidase (penicillin-binding protein 4)